MRLNGKHFYSIIAVLVIAGLTFGSSLYTKSTLNPNELAHFFVPFPAGKVMRPMTVSPPGGSPIFTRPIVIDVEGRGILKRVLNPSLEGLSTHWLTNVDTQPHRIGLKFTNVNVPIEWEVGAGIPWDSHSHTFMQPIAAGASVPDLGIDWMFHFPDEVRARTVWYEGSLVVFDADSGAELTVIPIKFQKGGANESTGRPKTS